MNPIPSRRPFEGMANIVRFNWPFFAVSLVVIGAAFAFLAVVWARWTSPFSWILTALISAGILGAAWFLVSSLAASYWIYDRSPLYRWTWLPEMQPRILVNVHSGFDESSAALHARYPLAEMTVLDFYDPVRAPEPSIARARKLRPPAIPARTIRPDAWPLTDGIVDLVTIVLAAHELRREPDREAFFREVRRVLGIDGRAVLVEHLRDAANFLAFGPGFFHFLPRSKWLQAVAAGGLRIEREFPVTPFIRVFILAPC